MSDSTTSYSAAMNWFHNWKGHIYIGDDSDNTVYLGAGPDAAYGGGGNDQLHGGGGNDLLIGGPGNDKLFGDSGNDWLFGGSGNDWLNGGAGADTLVGGSGADTFAFTALSDSRAAAPDVIADFTAGQDVVDLTGLGLNSHSLLTLNPSGQGSRLFIDANNDGTPDSVIEFRTGFANGSDIFTGLSLGLTINGGAGRDALVGSAYNDVLNGMGGADTMSGGAGNDTYYVDNAGDQVVEKAHNGDDTVITSVSYTLGAGQEIETLRTYGSATTTPIDLTGNEYNNTLVGNDAANMLDGKGGVDLMYGYGGNDTYFVDNARDGVFEASGGGDDTVVTSVSYALAAGQQIEHLRTYGSATTNAINLTGNEFANVIEGNAAANLLRGGGGDDRLLGFDGNDVLTGGSGADILTGGAGHDTFRDTAAGLNGDTITDFGRGDVINITDATYAGFSFTHSGTTLQFGGTSIDISGGANARYVVNADTHGGVDISIGAHMTGLNDFNGDGHSDILWLRSNGDVSTWDVSGTTALQVQQNASYDTSPGANWQLQGTMDFNGDGLSDLLFQNASNGQVSIWEANGNGGFQQSSFTGPSAAGSNILGLGDFNGDGRDDLLVQGADGYLQTWQPSDGSHGSGFVIAPLGTSVASSWHVQGVGDFDGDGRADILWRNDSGAVSLWSSNGSNFDQNTYYNDTVASSWHVAGVGDFNGDGHDDIIWQNDSGALSTWQASGSGFAENTYSNSGMGSAWHVADVADFNADGRADLLLRSDTGAFSIWESTGSSFTEAYTNNSVGTEWSIATHHYDIV